MTEELPPPFFLGRTYLDREGEYLVIAVNGGQITVERHDGRQLQADAALKARIHRNLLLEKGRHPTLRKRRIKFEGNQPVGFRFSEVFPLIAETIRSCSAGPQDFVTHEQLVTALVTDGELASILRQLEDGDPQGKSQSWWASNMIAWFSQVFTTGRSEYEGQFNRRKLDGNWAYAVAK